jgi:hypothetical protein
MTTKTIPTIKKTTARTQPTAQKGLEPTRIRTISGMSFGSALKSATSNTTPVTSTESDLVEIVGIRNERLD